MGIHNTFCNLCRTCELCHVMPLFCISGARLTKVVSNGSPCALIGIVLSSMPKCTKSCSAFDPAFAPSAVSINCPIQPLSRFKSFGTGICNISAISPNRKPANQFALANSSASEVGSLAKFITKISASNYIQALLRMTPTAIPSISIYSRRGSTTIASNSSFSG